MPGTLEVPGMSPFPQPHPLARRLKQARKEREQGTRWVLNCIDNEQLRRQGGTMEEKENKEQGER